MFTASQLPLEEAQQRHEKCRQELAIQAPHATGMLLFSRTNIYYLTGTRANGILWLPREGEPVLMVRKGLERCRLESPLQHIVPFKSYTNLPQLCENAGSPLITEHNATVGTEMRALPWSLAEMLVERLQHCTFVDISAVLDVARYTKTNYEQEKLAYAAAQQSLALFEMLPATLHAGMSERHIAHTLWKQYYTLGHGGMLRQDRYSEDVFLGSIGAGVNSLYPSLFRTTMGSIGEHPAMPYMGYAGSTWKKGQLLTLDTGFMHEGYHSNVACTYFCGTQEELAPEVKNAYALCVQILTQASTYLRAGVDSIEVWNMAKDMVQKAGFEENFMGGNTPTSNAFCYSIGLSMEEGSALMEAPIPFEVGNVLVLAPMVALPHVGMVAIKALFRIDATGSTLLSPYAQHMPCVMP